MYVLHPDVRRNPVGCLRWMSGSLEESWQSWVNQSIPDGCEEEVNQKMTFSDVESSFTQRAPPPTTFISYVRCWLLDPQREREKDRGGGGLV